MKQDHDNLPADRRDRWTVALSAEIVSARHIVIDRRSRLQTPSCRLRRKLERLSCISGHLVDGTMLASPAGRMMNRIRDIALEEQRQLLTFGLAIVVFLMTLFALQLRNQDSTLNRVGNANREAVSHALRQQDVVVSARSRAVALAASSFSGNEEQINRR
jgi:hypothetical protein